MRLAVCLLSLMFLCGCAAPLPPPVPATPLPLESPPVSAAPVDRTAPLTAPPGVYPYYVINGTATLCGAVDQDGRELFPPEYDYIRVDESSGLLFLRQLKKYSIANSAGEILASDLDYIFSSNKDFVYAIVYKSPMQMEGPYLEELAWYIQNGASFTSIILDAKTGGTLVKDDDASMFLLAPNGGIAWMRGYGTASGRLAVLDSTALKSNQQKILSLIECYSARVGLDYFDYSDRNNITGRVDAFGVPVLPCEYEDISAPYSGAIPARKNGQFGLFKNGAWLPLPDAEQFFSDPVSGHAIMFVRDGSGVRGCLIDGEGRKLTESYDNINWFNAGSDYTVAENNRGVKQFYLIDRQYSVREITGMLPSSTVRVEILAGNILAAYNNDGRDYYDAQTLEPVAVKYPALAMYNDLYRSYLENDSGEEYYIGAYTANPGKIAKMDLLGADLNVLLHGFDQIYSCDGWRAVVSNGQYTGIVGMDGEWVFKTKQQIGFED